MLPQDDDVQVSQQLRHSNVDALVERLDDPKTVAALLDLLDVLPTLSGTLVLLDGFYSNSEHILENIRGSLIEMTEMVSGTTEAESAQKLIKLGQQAVPVATQVADSGVLESLARARLIERAADPELLNTLGAVVDGVSKAAGDLAASPDRKLGVFKLLSALKDPDTSRGMDFALRVFKELGAGLDPRRTEQER
ncbi:DUF1641 domain-containing protein [Gordonia sp. PP30]|uniref:DUF1641 domain-containing protein n=1 Tax=Gordonia sp. PP30 TaxID=2935861 RepID=UPI001FFE3ABA|nr:DUF1641 domain-containing protein [Gordonia sp. PP30]UQE76467.1 DUF1641 domain-containing protein [Gordonia sp. PP30]